MQFIDLKSQYEKIKIEVNDSIQNVLEHGQYIMGREVDELENVLSRFTASKHCISVSSGTDALLLALMAIDIKPGDEIITPAFSYYAAVEVIKLLRAEVVFVDVDKDTYNIDVKSMEDKITSKTKAIIPVSLYGQCANYTQINQIATKHDIPVIEDAAQSFGAKHQGVSSCNLTTIGCTSFFPSKPLGCYGDGGACFTNDDAIADKIKKLRVHGQERRYHHTHIGLNARMDTLQAAILLTKMKVFEKEIKLRDEIGSKYNLALKDYVKVPTINEGNTSVYGQYTIEVENRDEFRKRLSENGVPTAVHYPIPVYLQPSIQTSKYPKGSFPNSDLAAEKVVSLPMHPYLNEDDQNKIISEVKNAIK